MIIFFPLKKEIFIKEAFLLKRVEKEIQLFKLKKQNQNGQVRI
jgi:hypothetical protein